MSLQATLELLDMLIEDHSIPKNVRLSLSKIKDMLKNASKDELPVKIDAAMQIIEAISSDPNLPSFTRTQIWNLTSLLESINNQ